MNIPKELLAEKNYSGTRKILVNDPKVRELKEKLKGLQKSINPIIDGLQDTLAKIDAANVKLQEKHKAIKVIQEEMEEIRREIAPENKIYDKAMEEIRPFEEEVQLIINKLDPLVMKIVGDQLEEFERPLHVTEDNDSADIYVEIIDEIEQFIQTKREQKAKAKAKEVKE